MKEVRDRGGEATLARRPASMAFFFFLLVPLLFSAHQRHSMHRSIDGVGWLGEIRQCTTRASGARTQQQVGGYSWLAEMANGLGTVGREMMLGVGDVKAT